MRLSFLFLLLVSVLVGCKPKPEIPDGIIPAGKMKLVMYDMMKSGEFLSGYVLYRDTDVNKIGESMKWYNKVWQIHKITEAEFRKSYEWYKNNPKIMSALMDSIMVIPAPPLQTPKTDTIAPLAVDSLRRVDSLNRSKLMPARERLRDSLRRTRGLLAKPS